MAYVEPQIDIGIIAGLMFQTGHAETVLQMDTDDPNKRLRMWIVGDGVLIATYDSTTNNTDSVEYHISSDGPKANRKNWSFPVETYDPEDGTMTISIDKR